MLLYVTYFFLFGLNTRCVIMNQCCWSSDYIVHFVIKAVVFDSHCIRVYLNAYLHW